MWILVVTKSKHWITVGLRVLVSHLLRSAQHANSTLQQRKYTTLNLIAHFKFKYLDPRDVLSGFQSEALINGGRGDT
jgi:hypothetical protein